MKTQFISYERLEARKMKTFCSVTQVRDKLPAAFSPPVTPRKCMTRPALSRPPRPAWPPNIFILAKIVTAALTQHPRPVITR